MKAAQFELSPWFRARFGSRSLSRFGFRQNPNSSSCSSEFPLFKKNSYFFIYLCLYLCQLPVQAWASDARGGGLAGFVN